MLSTPCGINTREPYENPLNIHSPDNAKIEEEMKYDGYYAIVTSGLDMPDEDIIDIYRKL